VVVGGILDLRNTLDVVVEIAVVTTAVLDDATGTTAEA
jgi:hypothetical protein